MIRLKPLKILSFVLACSLIASTNSCGSGTNNADTQKCKSLISDYAEHFTDNECEELCKLMFTDNMMRDCNKLYYAAMHLMITNRNLKFKEGFTDVLFGTVEYDFENVSFEKLSKDELENIQNYYMTYLGYDIVVEDGYLASATYTITHDEKLEIPVEFPMIKVNNEWKVSAQIWHKLFGQPLEPFNSTFEDVIW